jgi:hypothetical protein
MIERLDDALEAGHADFTASRTTAQEIAETRAIRVGVKLAYRGRPWATVPLEISSAEGRSAAEFERVPARPVDLLGIGVPADIPCVSLRYQIAQKLHACTQVFDDGPANSRFRDVIDLLLLRELLAADDLLSVRAACVETFELRATHLWPSAVAIGAGWAPAYAQLAAAVGFHVADVEDAAERVRSFVAEIDRAR